MTRGLPREKHRKGFTLRDESNQKIDRFIFDTQNPKVAKERKHKIRLLEQLRKKKNKRTQSKVGRSRGFFGPKVP